MSADVSTDVRDAMGAAVNFLLSSQGDAGDWKDFLLPAGNSDVWVTAFVGDVLAADPDAEAQQAARAGFRFLEQAVTPEGGWSYNPAVPGDADSTLWGLRLAETLGIGESASVLNATEFLQRHVRADGGLATYALEATVRNYIGLPPMVSFEGWTQSHICVTAAGANLGAQSPRFRQYLLENQAADGKWAAYWWFDDEYSTAEAVAALAGKNRTAADCDSETAASIEQAVQWSLDRCEKLLVADAAPQPVFALAHLLRILARTARPAMVAQCLSKGYARLVQWQKPNGSWPASAKLRVPRPDARSPDADARWVLWSGMPAGPPSLESVLAHTFTIYSPDHYGIYTTATVLRALQEISYSQVGGSIGS